MVKLNGNKDKAKGLYAVVKRDGGNWLMVKMDASKEKEYREEKKSNILDYPQLGLDSAIWDEDGTLRKEVKDQVYNKLFSLLVGQGFIHFDEWVIDAYILGSLTSYQYTRKSDIDVHVAVDAQKFVDLELPGTSSLDSDLAIDMMNADWRTVLNVDEKETVFGTDHPIEYYFEHPEQMEGRCENPKRHDGIYSTVKDEWLLPPRTIDLDFDPEEVFKEVLIEAEKIASEFDLQIGDIHRDLKEVDLLLEAVANLEPQHKIIFAEKIRQKLEEVEKEIEDFVEKGIKIKEKRQEQYEMTSPQNIIFKYLARYGYLYVYFHLKRLLEDDARITEDEVEEALQILRERMSSLRISSISRRF